MLPSSTSLDNTSRDANKALTRANFETQDDIQLGKLGLTFPRRIWGDFSESRRVTWEKQ